MDRDLRFGLFLGQVGQSWGSMLERFHLAEEMGFDHAYLVDHFTDTDGNEDAACLEAWTLLAALAASTSRIRIGVLVSSNTYRHPSLLMKEAATVDQISGGRLILGLGAGWYEPEHRMYGFPFPEAGVRVDRLEEAVQIAQSLMRQDRTTFHGRYYDLVDAPFEPKPVQRPGIPLLIAAHRPRMLRLAARYADIWDTFPTIPRSATEGLGSEIARRVQLLDRYCEEIGRDSSEIRRSTWAGGDKLHSDAAYLDFVNTYRSLGFTDFTTGLPGPEHLDAVRHIATEVIPSLRSGK